MKRGILLILSLLLFATGCAAPHQNIIIADGTDLIAAPPVTPSPFPLSTPSPAETQQTETAEAAYERLGCVYAQTAFLYAEPDQTSEALLLLPQGQTLHISPAQDGYYAARCGETEGFVRQEDTADLGFQQDCAIGMVNVRTREDSILCYMLFAQQDNFCGHPLYDADVCMLESDTYAKLYLAQQRFMQDGYRIKLNDAYRPQRVQYVLFEEIPDRTYIANPDSGSRHNRGLAVDTTLVSMETGLELEMPSPMHTFGGAGRRDYKHHSTQARKNMDYMTAVMEECGFTSIRSEWWHFMDLSNESAFPLLDLPQSSFVLSE